MRTSLRSLRFLLALGCLLAAPAVAEGPTPSPDADDSMTSLLAPNPPRVSLKPGRPGAVGDDATARLEWMRREQGIPTPEFRRRLMQERSHRQALERDARAGLSSAGISPAAAGPVWVPIGPEGADYETNGFTGFVRDSGRVRRILPHPTDPDTLYLLTSGGGLWVTHDFTAAATAWTPLTDTLPTTGGGSVAFGRTPGVPSVRGRSYYFEQSQRNGCRSGLGQAQTGRAA